MLLIKNIKRLVTCYLMVMLAYTTVQAQTTQPIWWFGVSGAANFNFYDGTTQQLNNSIIVPSAFHKGFGARPYGSVLVEYRPAGVWGATLNVGYDDRGGKFNNVIAACNCLATLHTTASDVVIEPALRLAAGSSKLYFFAGPSLSFNVSRDFSYTQFRAPDVNSQLSSMRKTMISGQVGAGYEIPLSSKNSTTKVDLSPFVSFHPYFGRAPRDIESWQITTLRAGIALKFGKGKRIAPKEIIVAVLPVHDVSFIVRAPKTVPLKRQVSETLPLLNSIFFEEGSTAIPNRYNILTAEQAAAFKEDQLQNEQTPGMGGRSGRQLNIYHNILNILGDRMRSNPDITIVLNGASAQGLPEGKAFAESVKQYLVSMYGISGSRITTLSRIKPVNPSEHAGGNKELALLRAEDRRVDIESTSPGLLMEVGGGMMRPVQFLATQVDPLDSHVLLEVDSARELLKSWSVNVTDEKGTTQHYGPYTRNHESIPGTAILGNNPTGDYKIEMVGETKNGSTINKYGTVHLIREEQALEKGYRYSIVFDFDRSKSIASYDKFLTTIVAPLITDNSTVIIHGHTDIIGEADYNQKLSDSRAQETQKIIGNALAKAGKNNVKFETLGFGADADHSPFENSLPEERFYNRTVIIDIIPVK